MIRFLKRPLAFTSVFLIAGSLCSCQQEMAYQPKMLPYKPSAFFSDGTSARPVPEGTVARDDLIPRKPARTDLKRGKERYEIYCTPCHDSQGTGHGKTTERGFEVLESFHTARIRALSDDSIYETIQKGRSRIGRQPMLSFGARIPPSDRWAIIAYLRQLASGRKR